MAEWNCLFCNKKHSTLQWRSGKFCNQQCHLDYKHKSAIDKWLSGINPRSLLPIRKYLKETFGNKCSICGITDWNNKPITLELEHIDGNSENNSPKNLCLICPNCHSQTLTYKNKNKGKGRYSRRIRYAEGKSY